MDSIVSHTLLRKSLYKKSKKDLRLSTISSFYLNFDEEFFILAKLGGVYSVKIDVPGSPGPAP